MRVHDLAKNLGKSSKELIALMDEMGIEGKTHSSGLEPDQVTEIEVYVKGDKAAPKPASKASKAKSSRVPETHRSSPFSKPSASPRSSGTGTAGKPTGFDRKARVQRMLIQRKLARQQKATPSPEEIAEPEITIQVIEEKEKPQAVVPPESPKVEKVDVQPATTQVEEPPKLPEKDIDGEVPLGVIDLVVSEKPGDPHKKKTRKKEDESKIGSRKRGAYREKGRQKDQTREVITDGIETLKEIAPTPSMVEKPTGWPGGAQRRPGPPRGGRPGQVRGTGGGRRRKAIRREQKEKREQQLLEQQRIEEIERRIVNINEASTVADLAEGMRIPINELIGKLMSMGVFAAKNQRLDRETIEILCEEYQFEIRETSLFEDISLLAEEEEGPNEPPVPRSPVVTIMGHVDHGKTKLLDAVRNSSVVDGEYGGITQHIGAYDVILEQGRVVFLDTPGHEAFTAMRARGAMVTDIVVLVVAADDGVMPQTLEALSHAKAAGVPIVVAVNKIDKEGADPNRVRTQLSQHGLMPEQWGGKHAFVDISALKKTGINDLMEVLLLESEVLELKANPDRRARGTIIEAKMDQGRGPVGTVLVQNGTVRIGDSFVTGIYSGKVRALVNDKGEYVDSAGPSTPVEILGLDGVPVAGDLFVVVADERGARQISVKLQQIQRARDLRKIKHVSLEDLHAQIAEGMIKELNIIVKADVQGSVGALIDALGKIPSDKVKTNIIHNGVGTISESDVMLASASNALILGFNIRPTPMVQDLAERENVAIRTYRVIYDAIADIRDALEGLLESKYKEVSLGRCEIREVFRADSQWMIAGGYVTSGKMLRNAKLRILRDDVVIHEGKLDSLRRFKEDVREVTSGFECGVGVYRFGDIKTGDIIECYELAEVKQTLES